MKNIDAVNIKSRLDSFKNKSKEEMFKEFQFCLLTPQSNAQRCWEAVEQLSKISNPTEKQINDILSTKTRFHNTKTLRILNSKTAFEEIHPILSQQDKLQLRNQISSKVNGYGLKEAGHFLRNIGHSDNQIAILDRHILKNLHESGLIQEPKIKGPKHYLELEQSFLNYCKEQNIEPDVLDLHWWSQENGEIFK